MEKIMEWEKFKKDSEVAKSEYINYLINSDVFKYLYEEVLKKGEYPKIERIPNTASLDNVRDNVKFRSNQLLNGVDLNVKWAGEKSIDILSAYGHKAVMIRADERNVFDIPIETNCFNYNSLGYYQGNDENFKDILFKYIRIAKDEDKDIVESIYFKNIINALIMRNWHMGLNPLFHEYIPFLLEMLYNSFILESDKSLCKGMLNNIEIEKKRDIILCSSEDMSTREVCNLASTTGLFLANITFEKFMDLDANGKFEMIEYLQKVLNGIYTIEDFVRKYEINFDNDEAVKLYKRSTERALSYSLK